MPSAIKLDRRAVLKGIAGTSLALPVLEAMGGLVVEEAPRRFCAIYTANGMSLPKKAHGIDEWSWFPGSQGSDYVLGKSTEPLSPFRKGHDLHGRHVPREWPQS